MVPLMAVTHNTGGLQVVPFSHTDDAKAKLKKENPRLEGRGDWCPLYGYESDAVLLLAEPGDLILWDSRTIHGGLVGTGETVGATIDDASAEVNEVELARLAVT